MVAQGIRGRYKELRKECGDGGEKVGLIYASLPWVAVIPIPVVQVLAGFGTIVFWIGYWIKVAEHTIEHQILRLCIRSSLFHAFTMVAENVRKSPRCLGASVSGTAVTVRVHQGAAECLALRG